MSSSSNSSWSVNRTPKIFKVDLDGNLYCHHEIVPVLRMAGRKSIRYGDQFYGCPQWPLSDCKFFMWKQDFDKLFEAHSNCSSSPVSYEELKNENLQLQNKLLLEENKMLKSQIHGKESTWKQPFVFTLFFCHCHMDVHVEVVIEFGCTILNL
ncbi:putative transcription factor GRF family [Helianthus annuus]|uniref:Transcription factor GRF family n=1 Tax=Helianthus annuus TaxID=4232 RepID=A0A9K3IS41_HELAN|nr:putative transcription factor GRF family [Helianthus annuus]KAJ0566062.1 putative transcription factor GRF family [Helianthus annuus]KAJ0572903.1 putative transcription factor GRF family [Helianthus annuus]KAJ0779678.1 putative transcription factor GRF family [Helianthus annuus]KAJ0911123.1 putative transcription factor GRF family [Helianthus annuus]